MLIEADRGSRWDRGSNVEKVQGAARTEERGEREGKGREEDREDRREKTPHVSRSRRWVSGTEPAVTAGEKVWTLERALVPLPA
jgi:hypothetical protein